MNAIFRALKMAVYETLGPDEIGAKPCRHVVRQKNIYCPVCRYRQRAALESKVL
jgi:hypothetical protein